ncbi:L,D-transpeptidase [Pararhodobacter oceanensis]|uniref:L,D-transpeptidase n=1 Tax=Pararhodobacter oceanensis TaxID=2172121 RepID=UPI003A8DA9BF
MTQSLMSRRAVLTAGAAALAMPALSLRAHAEDLPQVTRHNVMGFRAQDWRPYFDTLARGAILCDMDSRVLHFWSADGSYRLYPSTVPISEDYTRRGYTEITLKRRNPVWIPTPSMRAENPDLPARIEAGPLNPMGTRALNLTWQYYRVHGTDNVEKIGRRASSGCIGLHNHHVEELFEQVMVGTPVLLI